MLMLSIERLQRYYYSVPYFNERDYASIDKDLLGNYSYSQSKRELITATLMEIIKYLYQKILIWKYSPYRN
jgi:hypothetical protein